MSNPEVPDSSHRGIANRQHPLTAASKPGHVMRLAQNQNYSNIASDQLSNIVCSLSSTHTAEGKK